MNRKDNNKLDGQELNGQKNVVRKAYGDYAKKEQDCCGPSACCGDDKLLDRLGYKEETARALYREGVFSLGCGNPTAISNIQPGETVVDLGCGGGFDCFLAAHKVGNAGTVIGVDMTPEMVERARETGARKGYNNVEFRLGEIEHLPLADACADVIISNCVINLSPQKAQVFQEMHRVLKPGGRIAISDVALKGELPDAIREDEAAYVGCIAGAVQVEEYERIVTETGFENVAIESTGPSICSDPEAPEGANDPAGDVITRYWPTLKEIVVDVYMTANKPYKS